jgi:hypothetical protein
VLEKERERECVRECESERERETATSDLNLQQLKKGNKKPQKLPIIK